MRALIYVTLASLLGGTGYVVYSNHANVPSCHEGGGCCSQTQSQTAATGTATPATPTTPVAKGTPAQPQPGPPGCWDGDTCTLTACRAKLEKNANEDTIATLERHQREAHALAGDGKPCSKEVRAKYPDGEWTGYDALERRLTIKTGGKTIDLALDGDKLLGTLEAMKLADMPAAVKKGLDETFGGYELQALWRVAGESPTYHVRFGRQTAECREAKKPDGQVVLLRCAVHREHLAVVDASGKVLDSRATEAR